MKLLEENEWMVWFGVSGFDEVLFVFKKIDNVVVLEVLCIGLFYIVFFLLMWESLVDVLLYLVKLGYLIDGVGDYVYSEVFYLYDIEGNGIEIYVDCLKVEWMCDGDGNLLMVIE